MPVLESADFLETLSVLARTNPFSPKWVLLEKEALDSEFQELGPVHLLTDKQIDDHPNLVLLAKRTEELAPEMLREVKVKAHPNQEDRDRYQYPILFLLYRRYRKGFDELINTGDPSTIGELWQKFSADFDKFFPKLESQSLTELLSEHVFAWFFQIRRAYRHIFTYIAGSSEPIIQLRERVWNSIFTHDVQKYSESLYTRMSAFNTLITGESGTGKELVARAIGLSQYIPFDRGKRQFEANYTDSFRAVNLAGMPAGLIESELFGHVKGAFTGATSGRKGWLETANNWDALFLDEIGELDHSIQVKLLRAIETRTFYRIGGRKELEWKGKIIAATNRDLAKEVRKGRFREDLYYRLCGDVIVTPSLRAQLNRAPEDLKDLVLFATTRVAGDNCQAMAEMVEGWIVENMQKDYPWPGNFRELEQCARNVLIHGEYHPLENAQHREFVGVEGAVRELAKQKLSADEVVRAYCVAVFEQEGWSYEATGKRIVLNWRTVKRHILAAADEDADETDATPTEHPRHSGTPTNPK